VTLLALCLTTALQAHSETNRLDVSGCFSPLLVTHEIKSSVTNYDYYYLAMMDETTYDKMGADAKTKMLTAYGFGQGDFSYFHEQRRHYFEQHSENIKYYQATASNVSFLPLEWRQTIQQCIHDTLQNASKGLSYLTINSSPKRFRLEIKYKSTEKVHSGPWVKSSEIIGGYMTVDGKRQTSLYPPCSSSQKGPQCPSVDSKSEFTVWRDDPNEPVTISLDLSDDEYSTSFDVDVVPKSIKCTYTYEGSPTETKTLPAVPVRLTEHTYGSGGWQSTIWIARVHAPGKVTYVERYDYNDATDMHLLRMDEPSERQSAILVAKEAFNIDMSRDPDWQDDLIFVVGTQKGGAPTKTIAITAEYKVKQTTCSEQDWK
jgi:hypothetical protein